MLFQKIDKTKYKIIKAAKKNAALLQNHMQRELVSAELSFVVGGADLQDAWHMAGGIDASLHGCLDGIFAYAVYYYLKDG
jgi:hypothetical protein